MLIRDCLITLRIAMKASAPWIFLWLIVALIAVVLMGMQFSARQPATVALDIGVSMMRLSIPILVALLVQELINREFERKLYLTTLSYPRPRTAWLFGRVLGISLIALVMLVVMSLILAGLVIFAQSGYTQATPVSLAWPYVVTLMSIALDGLVVISIATLLAVSATTPSLVLIGTIGFILIARSYTPIIALLQSNPNTVSEYVDPHLYQDSLGLIAFLVPDLGRLDVRMVALYDKMQFLPADWPLLVVSTFTYAIAILALSAWVLNKRELS